MGSNADIYSSASYQQNLWSEECADIFPRWKGYGRYLELDGVIPNTCDDARAFCGVSSLIRALCPLTCGCADASPSGDVLLIGPADGCPLSCIGKPLSSTYLATLQEVECTEPALDDVYKSSVWQSWSEQFANTLLPYPIASFSVNDTS